MNNQKYPKETDEKILIQQIKKELNGEEQSSPDAFKGDEE